MKNYKMQRQSSSNPFLTVMMMFNIETKFVCTPSGNQFCLSYWLQKSNCLRYLRSFSSPANEMNFLNQRYFFKAVEERKARHSTQRLEISKAKRFSILASLFLKRIMQAFNCRFEYWLPFQTNSKIHLKRFVSAIFLKFHNDEILYYCSFNQHHKLFPDDRNWNWINLRSCAEYL